VCAVQGWREYEPIARDFGVPLVVTGFEPLDLLEGILMCVRQLEEGRHEVENQYVRAVVRDGNAAARAVVDEVFETADRAWRGIGVIERSGLRLRAAYAHHDAELLFPAPEGAVPASESELCIAGDVLRGRAKPHHCPAFGTLCTPEHPLGAPMVSSEGACAAYFLAGRVREEVTA
jgi:hydrogenase expression/formation protein HypD